MFIISKDAWSPPPPHRGLVTSHSDQGSYFILEMKSVLSTFHGMSTSCSRMPLRHSLAALIQASQSRPTISSKCLSRPRSTVLTGSEGSSQTHLLGAVGPPVQQGAGCLSSFLGLWGHLEQQVYADVRHKGREFTHSGVIENTPPKHFLDYQIIILASAVKTFKGQANYSDGRW